MADSPLDRKVLAMVREAEKGLAALQGELAKTLKKIKTGEVDNAKTLAASKKLMAFMKKFIPVTKIQNSAVYDKLSPEARAKVDWMDGLMGELLGTLTKLNKAKSDAKKDPAKNYAYLVKASSNALSEVPKQPPGVGTLIKQIKKANDPNFDGAGGLAILPMAILLWMIMDTIIRGLKKRP